MTRWAWWLLLVTAATVHGSLTRNRLRMDEFGPKIFLRSEPGLDPAVGSFGPPLGALFFGQRERIEAMLDSIMWFCCR